MDHNLIILLLMLLQNIDNLLKKLDNLLLRITRKLISLS